MSFFRGQQKEPWQERGVLPGRTSFFGQRFVQPSLVWGSLATFLTANIEKQFYHVVSWELTVASFFFVFFVSLVVYYQRD